MSKARDSIELNKTESATRTADDAADAALQSEIDATQSGSGLGVDGTYTANGSANYIDTATSLKNADDLLDSAIDSEVTNRTNADATIQSELDTTQTGAGLATDGSYSANLSSNYITTSTSLKDADNDLDAQIKTNADAITTETSNRTTADSTIQSELDATQTGAGLNANGTYSANIGATYISTSTSLKDADDDLDTAIDSHVSNTSNPHSVTAAQAGADPSGTASSAVSTHESTYNHSNFANGSGVNGSFTTTDGKTVTITNGIITNIV